MIEQRITWLEIKPLPADLPDADLEILVYDADLDDTVVASLDTDGEQLLWVDSITRQPLPAPRYWMHKPYPVQQGHHADIHHG
jgi:hypothetical protein